VKVRNAVGAVVAAVLLVAATQHVAGAAGATIPAWARFYGGSLGQGAADVLPTSNGGFIAAGWTRSFGAGDADAWIVTLDSAGGIVSQRAYGGTGPDVIFRLAPTSDGGYIAVGLSASFGAQPAPLVIKAAASGAIQWQKTYPTAGADVGNSIKQTSDGGYIVAGGTDPLPLGGSDQEATLLKLDTNGNIEWQKVFAAAGGFMSDVLQTADGGYLGAAESFASGNADILLVKLDATGTVQWEKSYGGGGDDSPRSLQPTADGGYFVAGRTTSFGAGADDAWLLKLGADGSIGWQRTYGAFNNDAASFGEQTSDGGYIVSGATISTGTSGFDGWVLKLDAQGNVDWQRGYDGGAAQDDARAVHQTPDGGFIVAGFTDPDCMSACATSLFSLFKVLSDGSINGSCPAGTGRVITGGSVRRTNVVAQDETVSAQDLNATANTVALTVTTTNGALQTVCTNQCGNGQLDLGEQCDDGNALNGDCCSSTCQLDAAGSLCLDDGDVCTIDTCDAAGVCTHVPKTPPCGVCTGPAGSACDDGDPGTARDICDGAGNCQGETVTGNYAILRWPPFPPSPVRAVLGLSVKVNGNVCTDDFTVGRTSAILGNAVSPMGAGTAMTFRLGTGVSENVVTGGGMIVGRRNVAVGGRVDTVGTAPELDECFAASYRANARSIGFSTLPVSPGLSLGPIHLAPGQQTTIPAVGTLGPGRVAIDTGDIRIRRDAKLILVGDPTTQDVIVRVGGDLKLSLDGQIALAGLVPEQVLFLVGGSVAVMRGGRVAGTVFTLERIYCGPETTIDGALVGAKSITVRRSATLNQHPFAGW
jgi:cysteine-rich repeat protein